MKCLNKSWSLYVYSCFAQDIHAHPYNTMEKADCSNISSVFPHPAIKLTICT
jgi:hypothetical protein